MASDSTPRLPPRQQLIGPDKWPVVGESTPRQSTDPWQVSIIGAVEKPLVFSLDELRSRIDFDGKVDIHCVTRWSKFDFAIRGVRLMPILEQAGVLAAARFISFTARSERSHSTSLAFEELAALEPIIALDADGEPLASAHGGPIRMVIPGRYFYKSVKWLETIELLIDDRLGYWESQAGYHNHADPWREERFMAPNFSKREAAERLEKRDFRDCELRGFDGRDRDLSRLDARRSQLRDADMRGANLRDGNFEGANLSGARLEGCDLRGVIFRGSDCEGCDFSGSDLRWADFEEASLFGATFVTPGMGLVRLGPKFPLTDKQLQMLTEEQITSLLSVSLESE